eukprot:Skav221310  [mRNA]  locus=scaffold2901:20303:23715:+ [translate_table: standard]
MAELSKKLGLFERVRSVCQSVAIPLPGVVVVGEQSAGKSSLLENISGIQFPRAQNTCTRMPCVLTLLTDRTVRQPFAEVSMNSNFADVTVRLVEQYIKPEEMVILCVIPAMSDFGNAEVVKLARKYDPDGIRTLGVVTKCDDAANAEASDLVEKVLMKRESDVRLELGFHCVVNRSQKNIDDGMSRDDLWAKEEDIFKQNERMRGIPERNWGTPRLMEKVAKIQEARVDECLPKIKDAVKKTVAELRKELRSLPAQAESEEEQLRLFNDIIASIRNDLVRRIRAEFMSADPADRELTIAPKVSSMVQEFRKELLEQNPQWLEEDMIKEVDDAVRTFVTGYTVENLTGSDVFINLIKQTFIEDGLLKESVCGLVKDVNQHLRKVVEHVIGSHANIHAVLSNWLEDKAEECIDQLTMNAQNICEMLAEAQQVTSTTHSQYMVKLTQFRKSWILEPVDGTRNHKEVHPAGERNSSKDHIELPKNFVALLKKAQEDPQRFQTLEICASLHVYADFMIKSFVEMSAKLVKFNMVEKLADKLDANWRNRCGSSLHELFPKDERLVHLREDLEKKIKVLEDFKAS